MAEFPLKLKHIAGKKNRVDLLSRRPDYNVLLCTQSHHKKKHSPSKP